jgi:uncharacterized alpha-E superfamily protein
VATWWCGQPRELEHTIENLGELVLKRAFAGSGDPVFGDELSREQLTAWREELRLRPHAYVGQQRLRLSTAPVWAGDRLDGRPLVLRAFVAWTREGYRVMPGGLTRVSPSSGSMVVSSYRGGESKDTWVLSEGPVERVTLLPPMGRVVRLDRVPGEVPSRVADNMFWLGRYIERLESGARLLRALGSRLEGESTQSASEELKGLLGMLIWMGWLPVGFDIEDVNRVEVELNDWVRDAGKFGSLLVTLQHIRYVGASLRDRLSMDTWRVLQQLQVDGRPRPQHQEASELVVQLNHVIMDCAAFAGMEMENMTRGLAWRFLDMGRRIERGTILCRWLRALVAQVPWGNVPLVPLLEICESKMTYRRMYFERTDLATVLDLLVANDANPRSLAFQYEALADHLEYLPGAHDPGEPHPEQELLLRLTDMSNQTDLVAQAHLVLGGQPQGLEEMLTGAMDGLLGISHELTHRYLSHAITRVC